MKSTYKKVTGRYGSHQENEKEKLESRKHSKNSVGKQKKPRKTKFQMLLRDKVETGFSTKEVVGDMREGSRNQKLHFSLLLIIKRTQGIIYIFA